MKKTIILNGKALEYELTRKSVKNINLRIRPDGSVAVSASKLVPLAVIENFIQANSDRIISAVEKRGDKDTFSFKNGEKIAILGKERAVFISKGQKNSVELADDNIIVTATENADAKRIFESYLKQLCLDTVTPICREVYPYFQKYGIAFPQIKVKQMVSRWGSCHPAKGIVTFSSYLMYAPIRCAKYVVLHEFTHFLHANHSKDFYRELEKTAPDWKACKQILNQVKIR